MSEAISTVGTYDAVKVLVRVLHSLDPIAAEDGASVLTSAHGRSKHKPDPELQQAMMCAADINWTQFRTLKTYLCYSNLDILQPETAMRQLQVDEFVRPIPIEFREGKGNRKRVSWYVPPDDLLVWNTKQKLKANAVSFDNLDKAHVILVGDHGQGAFQMMVTLLLITKPTRRRGNWRNRHGNAVENEYVGTKLALEVDGMCGYIQCQKDTYQILDDTIATPINNRLLSIKEKGRVTIFQTPDGDVEMCFGNIHTTQGVELASAPVELFVVGDLAFLSMILGKESMAPHWCWRCQYSKSDWTNIKDPRVGTEWTLDNLQLHLSRLE